MNDNEFWLESLGILWHSSPFSRGLSGQKYRMTFKSIRATGNKQHLCVLLCICCILVGGNLSWRKDWLLPRWHPSPARRHEGSPAHYIPSGPSSTEPHVWQGERSKTSTLLNRFWYLLKRNVATCYNNKDTLHHIKSVKVCNYLFYFRYLRSR